MSIQKIRLNNILNFLIKIENIIIKFNLTHIINLNKKSK